MKSMGVDFGSGSSFVLSWKYTERPVCINLNNQSFIMSPKLYLVNLS